MRLITIIITGMIFNIIPLIFSDFSYAENTQKTENIGRDEFVKSCSVCHGIDGKGDEVILDFLSNTPSDLTLISKKNDGVFPLVKVYEQIREPLKIKAHNSSDMPVWGERFGYEVIDSYGPYDTQRCNTVRERILELVFYIGTIQE